MEQTEYWAAFLACEHRGAVVDTITCKGCSFTEGQKLPVYVCVPHGRCTLRMCHAEVAFCHGCRSIQRPADWKPPIPPPSEKRPSHVPPWNPGVPWKRDAPDKPIVSGPEKLILRSWLSPGDIMTMTAAVESLHGLYPGKYLTDVRTPVPAIWEHNPHITPIADGEGRLLELHYPSVHRSNQTAALFLAGYTENLGEQLGIPLRLTVNRPCLYLSDKEKSWWSQVRDVWATELVGRKIPFWLFSAGIKNDYTIKQWPVEFYQEVVDRTIGLVQWVQIGSTNHSHPEVRGVLNLVGKTDSRQLIRLARHAQGGLGPPTWLLHLMAAFEKPYLCLNGGREPITWALYPLQHTFHTLGQFDCCRTRSCWKSRVVPLGDGNNKDKELCVQPVLGLERPVAKCMAAITPKEVVRLLRRYV